jgi:3-isopropylmalate/(R)-2-methylmalate dehydratase small subunit
MQPFTTLSTNGAPLALANIDTDQIIPKQFLTTIERKGLGNGLFFDFRFDENGNPKPDFVLNKEAYKGTELIIAGPNFGCGSSREHAPWALLDFGIRAIIANSYADIFYNNCFKNGILPIKLPQEQVEQLLEQAGGNNCRFDIDLAAQSVTAPNGDIYHFEIEPSMKRSLLLGLDDIADSLTHKPAIEDYVAKRKLTTPWL